MSYAITSHGGAPQGSPLGRLAGPRRSLMSPRCSLSPTRQVHHDVEMPRPHVNLNSYPSEQSVEIACRQFAYSPHGIQVNQDTNSISHTHSQDSTRTILHDALGRLDGLWSVQASHLNQVAPQASHMNSTPRGSNSTPSPTKSQPDALSSLQKLVAAVCVEMQILAESIAETRIEMRAYSDQVCYELEDRMKSHFSEHQKDLGVYTQTSTVGTSMMDRIEEIGKKYGCSLIEPPSRLSDIVDSRPGDAALSLNRAVSPRASLGFGSPEDEPAQHAKLVNHISDHVIARVNASPSMRELAESNQSIQESFLQLCEILQKSRWVEQEHSLHDIVTETQKNYRSISLELRQLRQRRNQDCSETELRFAKLEEKVRSIEEKVIVDPVQRSSASSAYGPLLSSNMLQKFRENSTLLTRTVIEDGMNGTH